VYGNVDTSRFRCLLVYSRISRFLDRGAPRQRKRLSAKTGCGMRLVANWKLPTTTSSSFPPPALPHKPMQQIARARALRTSSRNNRRVTRMRLISLINGLLDERISAVRKKRSVRRNGAAGAPEGRNSPQQLHNERERERERARERKKKRYCARPFPLSPFRPPPPPSRPGIGESSKSDISR